MSDEKTRGYSLPSFADAERTLDGFVPGRSFERRARARQRVPALTVLCHSDPDRVGERTLLAAVESSGGAGLSRLEPAFQQPSGGAERPLGDPFISRSAYRLRAVEGGLRIDAANVKLPLAVDGRMVDDPLVVADDRLAEGVVLELGDRVVLLLHLLTDSLGHVEDTAGLVGESEAITRLRQEIRQVADLDVPVLLRGETGTGKELVARAIHRASRRRQKQLLNVNMGAVAPSLAMAELFGAVKGAYTGAVRDHVGFFQRADGGTLFLDEIGEAPPEVQVMLLRVLESGEIRRLGTAEASRVDVRLLAATDSDLEEAIASGRFREPLLHRLATYEIHVPPLRRRRDDIGRLLAYFLRRERDELAAGQRPPDAQRERWLPASIVARLARYRWPGNVRQLRNVARQLVIASRGAAQIRVPPQVDRLLREAEAAGHPVSAVTDAVRTKGSGRGRRSYRSPSDVGEEELLSTLRAHRFEVKPTAAALGVSRPSLYNLIARSSRLRTAAELSADECRAAGERCAGDLAAMAQHLEVSASGLRLRLKDLGLSAKT